MGKNLIQKLRDLIKAPQKQLNKGINLEEMYGEYIANLPLEAKEKFKIFAERTALFDFQFDLSKTISSPAYDAYSIFSENFIRKIFENREMFDLFLAQLEKNKMNGNKFFSTIEVAKYYERLENTFTIIREYPVSILRAGYELYGRDKNKMPKEVREKIKRLEKVFSIDNILKKKEKSFSTYIDGEEFIVAKKDLLKLLTESDDQFNARFTKENEDKNYKLLMALKQFLAQGEDYPKLLEMYAFLEEHMDRYECIEYEKLSMLKNKRLVSATKTAYSDRITIHPKLREAVLEDMPPNMSEMEKAIYLYEKLCQILVYDSQYFVDGTGKRLEKHSNLMRLSTITPENNTIICYEFAYIYAKFLEEQGIHHEIRYGTGNKMDALTAKTESERGRYGGTTHAYCVVKADDIIFTADSTTTSFGGDLINAKTGQELDGLTIITRGYEAQQQFKQAYQNVRKLLKEQENNIPQSDLLKTYRVLINEEAKEETVNLEEKMMFLEKLLNSAGTANGMENYYYLSRFNKNFIR